MSSGDHRERGKLFNDVPALYEQVRPSYPDVLFADLAAVRGVDAYSSILEVGCGTGQATRPLAQLGCDVTAIEPGVEMAEHGPETNGSFLERRHRNLYVRSMGRAGPPLRPHRRSIVMALDRPEYRMGASAVPPSSQRLARVARPRRHPLNRRARGLRRDGGPPRAIRPGQPGLGTPTIGRRGTSHEPWLGGLPTKTEMACSVRRW
jgi:SAM-dependent methyltransferase